MSWELLYKRPYTGKGKEPETPEFMVRIFPDEYKRWKASKFSES